jgi:hypothetical protein
MMECGIDWKKMCQDKIDGRRREGEKIIRDGLEASP